MAYKKAERKDEQLVAYMVVMMDVMRAEWMAEWMDERRAASTDVEKAASMVEKRGCWD